MSDDDFPTKPTQKGAAVSNRRNKKGSKPKAKKAETNSTGTKPALTKAERMAEDNAMNGNKTPINCTVGSTSVAVSGTVVGIEEEEDGADGGRGADDAEEEEEDVGGSGGG